MSKQSKLCHLKNKYHGKGSVISSGSAINVIGSDGELLCSLEKTAHGEYECRKEENGARDAYCADPSKCEHEIYVQCKKTNKILKKEKVDKGYKEIKSAPLA